MEIDKIRRCGIVRAGFVCILAGLVAACADQSVPAPVFQRGSAEPIVAPAPPPARQVVVQRGQTLDGFAHTYHVSKAAIIAANRLQPPYELKTGSRLTIPGAGASVQQAMAPQAMAATPLPPPRAGSLAPPPTQAAIPQPPSSPQTVGPPPQTVAPPPSAARVLPEIIPLDGPPPKQTVAATPKSSPAALTPPVAAQQQAAVPPPIMPPRNASAALPLPGEDPGPQPGATSGQASTAGRFPWPVRGRILASYGNIPGGGHNDGINIAAPRGTPVRAIDAGTVAYAGNEVKGYGNIVLIKHANGWISAYAHLDDVTVKVGETIGAGQAFGKVGETGGVTEPQLHFELRRGKKPVDPKEFLAPAPSAEGAVGNKAG